jgi:hypothetical protein
MNTLRLAALLPLALGLLAGCQSASRPAGANAAATPTPASAQPSAPAPANHSRPLLAVVDDRIPSTLRLITLEGREVAHTSISSPASFSGVGGDTATFVADGQLKGLRPNGVVVTLGALRGFDGTRVTISPDGQQWLWAVASWNGDQLTSKLVLGSKTDSERTVADLTAGAEPRVLRPYRWEAAGPVYQSSATGLGGYILFDGTTGPSWRLDPLTGRSTSILGGTTCTIGDLASDGTIACFRHDGTTALEVLSPGGHVVEIPLSRPAFFHYGAVSFQPGSEATTLVLGGATGAGANGAREQYQTYLVDARMRTLKPLGPAGLRPGDGAWTWLSDGSVIAYRPVGAAGGDPGIYVVSKSGSAKRILTSGTPVGVLNG